MLPSRSEQVSDGHIITTVGILTGILTTATIHTIGHMPATIGVMTRIGTGTDIIRIITTITRITTIIIIHIIMVMQVISTIAIAEL